MVWGSDFKTLGLGFGTKQIRDELYKGIRYEMEDLEVCWEFGEWRKFAFRI